jgi:hypothetical protein
MGRIAATAALLDYLPRYIAEFVPWRSLRTALFSEYMNNEVSRALESHRAE